MSLIFIISYVFCYYFSLTILSMHLIQEADWAEQMPEQMCRPDSTDGNNLHQFFLTFHPKIEQKLKWSKKEKKIRM